MRHSRLIRSLLASLTALALFSPPALAAEAPQAGAIDVARAAAIEARSEAMRAGSDAPLAEGAEVRVADRMTTGPEGRIRSVLLDGAQVTLGEEGSLAVRAFEFDPDAPGGRLDLAVGAGAFLFIGGRIDSRDDGLVDIHTPVGRIEVRGLAVWGGMIDGAYGVLVVEGAVAVTTEGGTVTLKAGEATTIANAADPPRAEIWPNEKIDRAIGALSLR